MKPNFSSHRGFSLAEVLIASSLFVTVGLLAVTVFVNIMKIQRRVALENAIYEDGRFLMERLAREIRTNAVDYEEYYNKLVEKESYGARHGCYASRFYHPGNPSELGVECSNGVQPDNPVCIIDKTSLDINTGENPYAGNNFTDKNSSAASAFCDKEFDYAGDQNCGASNQNRHQIQDELYLIDSRGGQKTLFALKKSSSASVTTNMLAMVRLEGEDDNQDGVVEKWSDCANGNTYCCAEGFTCVKQLESSLSINSQADFYDGFVPLSPSRTHIAVLKFLIAPLEDPRKAFGETSPAIQQQPHVTILMKLEPSSAALQSYSGDVPSITLQTTITSRVYQEIPSFGGTEVCSSY